MSRKKRRTNRRAINWPIGGVVILLLIGCVVLAKNYHKIYKLLLSQTTVRIGATAPDFELSTLTGESVRLSQYSGQPVMVSFSESWCPDCARAAPLLQELHENHPELVVLLVDGNEAYATVQKSVAKNGFTFPVLLDPNGTMNKRFAIMAIPTVFFIDAKGVIRAKVIETVTPALLADALPLIGIEP